jgi:hypothetical protein
MAKAGFEKLQNSEKTLFGPRKLLLTGFSSNSQTKFKILLEMLGLSDLPIVWAASEQLDDPLNVVVDLPEDFGKGMDSSLPRAIIAGGITEKELRLLMSGCRKAGMKHTIWATLTPTSVTWPLKQLLAELTAEHKAMS